MSSLFALAAAVLVTNGVLNRDTAVDLLTWHAAKQPRPFSPDDEAGYHIARIVALDLDQGVTAYDDGLRTVALSLTRGRLDHFAEHLSKAAELLSLACKRLDRLRLKVSEAINTELASPEVAGIRTSPTRELADA